MKTTAIIFIFVLVISFQTAVLARLGIFGVTPNLLLAIAVASALCQKEKKIGWLIFVLSLSLDLLIGQPFGLITLSVCLVFAIIGQLGKFLFKQSGLISVVVLSAIGCFLYQIFLLFFLRLAEFFRYGTSAFAPKDFYTTLPLAVIYNGLFCILVYAVYKKVFKPLSSNYKSDRIFR